MVDHLNEVTVGLVADSGCWMGFSIYPGTKMSPPRMAAILREYGLARMLVNSAADWGRSDPLLTLRTGEAMLAGRVHRRSRWTRCCGVTRWSSSASPGGSTCRPHRSRPRTFADNSILRGRFLMRLQHPDGQLIHLGYCTNVHPGEDLPEILAQLDSYAVAVRRLVPADRLGVGLWLAAPVAAELAADPARVARLRRDLDARGLEVVTLNGFPYQSFHAPVVKHAVYRPDWLTAARLDYTVHLARVLSGLLPDDAARGSVSTLPLAWRTPPWTARAVGGGPAAAGQPGRAPRGAARRDRPAGPRRVRAGARLRAGIGYPDDRRAVRRGHRVSRRVPGPGPSGLCLGGAGRRA